MIEIEIGNNLKEVIMLIVSLVVFVYLWISTLFIIKGD